MVNDKCDHPSVLHVDDGKDIRALVMFAPKNVGGLDVTQFASGAETIKNADGIRADILLLDVMMPEMSGPETFLRLRTFTEFTSKPEVYLTASLPTRGMEELRTPGVAAIISKPFDPMKLAEQLTEIWCSHKSQINHGNDPPGFPSMTGLE